MVQKNINNLFFDTNNYIYLQYVWSAVRRIHKKTNNTIKRIVCGYSQLVYLHISFYSYTTVMRIEYYNRIEDSRIRVAVIDKPERYDHDIWSPD